MNHSHRCPLRIAVAIVVASAAITAYTGDDDSTATATATDAPSTATASAPTITNVASTVAATSVPAAAPTTAAQPATTATPSELIDRWVGPPRTIGTLGTGTSAAFVEITDGFLILETGNSDNPKAFGSDAVIDDDGALQLTLVGDVLDCVDGEVGHYGWNLSPQATTLTLTATSDDCAARQAAIEGEWTHTACRLEGRDCLGIVEAGTYSTNRWNPYGDFTYGQATFTLPDGWAVTYDSQATLFLGLADDYAANPDPDPWGIRAWADVAAAAQDPSNPANCTDNAAADPGVDTSAAAIADWMAALPSLNATRSTITIGGLPAEVVDAEIIDGAAVCGWGNVLIVSRTSKPDPFAYGMSAGQHMRVILVDVLPGRTVAMFLDDTAHPGFDALETAAMPIAESFVFSPAPPTT